MTTPSMFDLTGRKALVTGGNRGIGQAIAEALARAGADVAITARDEATTAETASRIQALGRKVVT
ncbi:SDR family NAD(P)-dependent oxidoreductase, partial [Rhizobiaceae sp. 2RAB30]